MPFDHQHWRFFLLKNCYNIISLYWINLLHLLPLISYGHFFLFKNCYSIISPHVPFDHQHGHKNCYNIISLYWINLLHLLPLISYGHFFLFKNCYNIISPYVPFDNQHGHFFLFKNCYNIISHYWINLLHLLPLISYGHFFLFKNVITLFLLMCLLTINIDVSFFLKTVITSFLSTGSTCYICCQWSHMDISFF